MPSTGGKKPLLHKEAAYNTKNKKYVNYFRKYEKD